MSSLFMVRTLNYFLRLAFRNRISKVFNCDDLIFSAAFINCDVLVCIYFFICRPMRGNPRQSWILDFHAVDSGFQELYSGF